MRRWVPAVAVVAVAVVLPGGASAASACATPPAAYSGTDATVAAVTQVNVDVDANCTALSDAIAAAGDAAQAHTDSGAVLAELQAIDSDVKASAPSGTVQLSEADRQLESDLSGQVDGDLWVLAGVVVGLFVAVVVVFKVMA